MWHSCQNSDTAAGDSWDPGKQEMLISTRFADASQVHLVPIQRSKPPAWLL
jgi:hypothetical protein